MDVFILLALSALVKNWLAKDNRAGPPFDTTLERASPPAPAFVNASVSVDTATEPAVNALAPPKWLFNSSSCPIKVSRLSYLTPAISARALWAPKATVAKIDRKS